MAQLVEALRYKPQGRGFESKRVTGAFSGRTVALGFTQTLTELSTWGVKVTGTDCFEIWDPQPPEPSRPWTASH